MAERIKPEEPAAGAGVEVHNNLTGRGAANAHPVSSVTNGMANPATSNLDMNNKSITNLKDASLGFKGGGSLTRTDYLDSITKKHTQNSDTKLDEGQPNEVTAADAKDAVDKKHTEGTDTALGAQAEDLDMNNHSIVNLEDSSLGFQSGGSLTRTDYLDSISTKHTQNTDLTLCNSAIRVLFLDEESGQIASKEEIYNTDISVVGTKIYALITFLTAPNTYAAFYTSSDYGVTWDKAHAGDSFINDTQWARLSIVPGSPNTLFVLYCSDDTNAYVLVKSTDEGATWSAPVTIEASGVGGTLGVCDISAASESVVFVAYNYNPPLNSFVCAVSTDGGATFPTKVTVAMPSVSNIRIDAASATVAYASTFSVNSSPAITKTIDGGTSWSTSETMANPRDEGDKGTAYNLFVLDADTVFMPFACDKVVPDPLVCVYRTINGGDDWTVSSVDTTMDEPPGAADCIAMHSNNADDVHLYYSVVAVGAGAESLRSATCLTWDDWAIQTQVGTDDPDDYVISAAGNGVARYCCYLTTAGHIAKITSCTVREIPRLRGFSIVDSEGDEIFDDTDVEDVIDKVAGTITRTVFLPIEWAEDGTIPPDDVELFTHNNGQIRLRKFTGKGDVRDVTFPWEVPVDIDALAKIKFQVLAVITEAIPPSDKGVSFKMSGYSSGDEDDIDGTFGSEVESKKTGMTLAQYDRIITDISGDVTITNFAAGELAMLHVERDLNDADDTFEERLGVYGIRITYEEIPGY